MTDFPPELPERDYRPIHPEPAWRALARKIWAPITVLIGLVVKFGFAFAKFASIFVAALPVPRLVTVMAQVRFEPATTGLGEAV